MKLRTIFLAALLIAIGTMIGCTNPENPPATESSLTGIVRDARSGQPLSGVTVGFGTSTDTTGADGGFSLALSARTGMVSGDFSLYKAGFEGLFAQDMPVDAANPPVLRLAMENTNGGSYPSHALSGKIYTDAEKTVELADGSEVYIEIYANGLVEQTECTYTAASGYSFADNIFFGSDCLVVIGVMDGLDNLLYASFNDKVDLSGTSTTLDVVVTPPSAVTVNGADTENRGISLLISSYGTIMGCNTVITTDAYLANPMNYPVLWAGLCQPNIPADYDGMQIQFGSPVGSSASYTLPTVDSSLAISSAPTTAPTYANGVLTCGTFEGANFYQARIRLSDGSYYILFSGTPSFTLPDWMKSALAGQSAEVSVSASVCSGGTRVWPMFITADMGEAAGLGMIQIRGYSGSGTDLLNATISF